jgi:HlyD family secretion protein
LLVQGEVDATRFDIAARVDGRVKAIPVERGQNVPAKAVLASIDNPETVAKLEQMKAAMAVAGAQLANVLVGTRVEVIAARKAELERTQAALVLAQKTFDRTHTLTEQGNSPQARLDQMTDTLHESERAVDQAQSAYDQAVNGYTREERAIAEANVEKANADIQSVHIAALHFTFWAVNIPHANAPSVDGKLPSVSYNRFSDYSSRVSEARFSGNGLAAF